ncbi:hypothetical protein BSKO_02917 [Bryopsis sp. KO-2023]|nr:hypothetical protein BSKO_02917 [Bryopsis sp. KO-2023]
MQARSWLFSVFVIFVSLFIPQHVDCQEAKAPTDRPNVVILLADDLGYDDLSLRGSKTLETPRIDAFANQSVQFNNFYSHASDAPSRAALLTGNHFLKTGIWGENAARNFLSLEVPTLGNVSTLNNYTTGLFGGWPNGDSPGYNPSDRSFEKSCAVQLHFYRDNNATCDGNVTTLEGWVAEQIADKAIGFIKENVDNPFMLYLPFITPHVGQIEVGQPLEFHAPPDLVEKYLEMEMSDASAAFHAAVEFMDTQVGRILDEIEESEIGNNTVVIFMSDNGSDRRKIIPESEWLARKPSNFRGEKGELYENGIKAPLFVRWTGKFDPAVVDQALVTVYDILPTLLDLGEVPDATLEVDGMSFVELLQNPTEIGENWWSNRTIYDAWEPPSNTTFGKKIREANLPGWGVVNKSDFALGSGNGQWMARNGDMKLLIVDEEEFLFNVTEDPSESEPVKDGEVSETLMSGLSTWWKGILANELSFSAPRFWVKRGVKESKVPFMGAAEMSKNITIKGYSAEFEAKNDTFFRFNMRVVDDGKYRIKYKVVTPPSTWEGTPLVTMTCGNDSAVVDRQPKGKVERWIGIMKLNFTGDDCSLEFKVKNGTGSAVVEWLSFVPWIEKVDPNKTKSTEDENMSKKNETESVGKGGGGKNATESVETPLEKEGESANNKTEGTAAAKNVTDAVETPIKADGGEKKNVTEKVETPVKEGKSATSTAEASKIETPISKNSTAEGAAGKNATETAEPEKKDAGRKLLTLG